MPFNYKAICPASEEAVRKMQKIPLVVEVWTKLFSKNSWKEELVGLARLNLQAVFFALVQ